MPTLADLRIEENRMSMINRVMTIMGVALSLVLFS